MQQVGDAGPDYQSFIGRAGPSPLDVRRGGGKQDRRKTMQDNSSAKKLNRREALGLIAVTAGGGAFMSASAFAQNAAQPASTTLLMPQAGVCAIMPETTEGPFYFDPELDRRDITEGREGVPLAIRLQVVDQQCRPLAGKRVDIWHCDAKGIYSGYPRQGDSRDIDTSGQKFMRGVRHTDESGIVVFDTIYPGWYRGRTTHIHFKAFLDESSVLTGQMFFPDDLSEHLFSMVAPYNDRPERRDMMNKDDRIALDAGPLAHAAIRESGAAYEALLIIGVSAA
jgi:protocatechuate 3,4-dioxygenase beta subunit